MSYSGLALVQLASERIDPEIVEQECRAGGYLAAESFALG